jgi:alpha-L-fucosidase 2
MYLAYHAAGLVESGESFLNLNWRLLPRYRKFARAFYGVSGAVVPGVMALDGQPLGGWGQYALSMTNGLWVGHSFYLHWRYTMDPTFLRERAYPWLSEVATAIVGVLEERKGKLYLPLSTSPEIHNNSMRAWLTPNTNYDASLIQWAFEALAEMATALGRPDESARWKALRGKLDDLDVEGEQGSLTFTKGEPYNQSHRHFSHTMAIHPLGLLHIEGSDRDRAIVRASVDRIHEKGTQAWVGYSFSWMACLAARTGRPEMALNYLRDYRRAFILRNGFHVNGDQIGAGLSSFRYRPFTLEGNFLAMEAVHEMLLQSWGNRIRIFPAVSKRWPTAAFDRLRGEGAFIVSARREKGATVWVRVTAGRDGMLRLRDPFGGAKVEWNRTGLRRDGTDLVLDMKAGESLEALRRERRTP